MLRDFKDQVKEDIQAIVGKNLLNYTTLEKNDTDNEAIKSELGEIHKKLETQNKHFDEYQKQTLAAEIIRFADSLRNGKSKSRNSFLHIAASYDRYKKLNGNHYIDEE
jgi:DNA-binding transcriptional regulator GbsR (MarR family)